MSDRHGPRMICPRCGIEQSRALECANCGIVVAKWTKNRRRIAPPTRQQAGLGALVVLIGTLIVAVMVWQTPAAPLPAPPPRVDPAVERGPSAANTFLDERWSSGASGFSNAVLNQQERKVALFVWIRPTECPSCGAVEEGLFRTQEVRAWLAQNERVRLHSDVEAEKVIVDKLQPPATPGAVVVRSNGERKPVAVFEAGTTTPLAPPAFLKGLRAAAGD